MNLETATETAEYAEHAEMERLLTGDPTTCFVKNMRSLTPSLSVYSAYSAV